MIADISGQFLANRHDLAAFIRSMCRDHAQAEDILHDVWVKLAEATNAGQRIDNVGAWCRTVAKHAIIRHWRHDSRVQALEERILDQLSNAFSESESPPDVWSKHLQALEGCVRKLDQPARALLEQLYVNGRNLHEIGKESGSNYNAVSVRLTRLRQGLKRCLLLALGES